MKSGAQFLFSPIRATNHLPTNVGTTASSRTKLFRPSADKFNCITIFVVAWRNLWDLAAALGLFPSYRNAPLFYLRRYCRCHNLGLVAVRLYAAPCAFNRLISIKYKLLAFTEKRLPDTLT